MQNEQRESSPYVPVPTHVKQMSNDRAVDAFLTMTYIMLSALQYWPCSTGLAVLALQYWLAVLALQYWPCSTGLAVLALQYWPCSTGLAVLACSTGLAVLALQYWLSVNTKQNKMT